MKTWKRLHKEGFAVLPDAIPDDLLQSMKADIARMEHSNKAPLEANYFSGFDTLRYHSLLVEGEVWQRVAVHQPVLETVGKVLGPGALLSLMGTALVNPGARQQPIHTDDDVYELPRAGTELVLNTVWALSDFSAENGATRVVVGSHKRPHPPDPEANYDTIPLEMKRGSIAFIAGRTYHSAGANASGARRDAVLINYCHSALRTHENLLANITAEQSKNFSSELRALLGFKPTAVGLGFRAR